MHIAELGAQAVAEANHRARILLVEDGPMTRALAQALLERADYAVDVADDGAAALAAVCRNGRDYDVLLMDLDLPVMDGYAAAKAIRALPDERGEVPILAFTALSRPEKISRALECGMDGHIAKPFDPAQLSASVRHCISELSAARLERRSNEAVATSRVWNPLVFRELSKRLAPAKTAMAVSLFEGCVLRAREILLARGDAGAIAFEAHNLISAAGMMGFEELSEAARQTQSILRSGVDEAERDRVRAELLAAVSRALDSLRRECPAGQICVSHSA